MSVIRTAVAVGLALALAACSSREPYACTADMQCVRGGQSGVCGAAGYCAFVDGACETGYRYDDGAGGGVAGTCAVGAPADATTSDAPPDAACGEVGQACCANATCRDGTCTEGTCTSCIDDVAFGRRFGCVLAASGSVWCAGENHVGQLGIGLTGVPLATRMQVRDRTTALVADATAIALGREHACAVRSGGTVWCWGDNDNGQLGNNATARSPAAVQVVTADNAPLADIVEVSAGWDHTCARHTTGEVYCWGNVNALGDGSTAARIRAAPVLVAAMGQRFSGALALYAGGYYSCARRSDGLWCWGANDDGQFGDGTRTDRPFPALVGPATAAATSHWSLCRVLPDSAIACSGWDRGAAFGTGEGEGFSGADHLTPVLVRESAGGPPFTGAVQIAAGSGTCAIRSDTSVVCWGDGQYGQNGTGASQRVPAPVTLPDGTPLTGVDRLVARWPHVCAHVMTTGAWLCWGRNVEGEFGDGTFASRPHPTPLTAGCP